SKRRSLSAARRFQYEWITTPIGAMPFGPSPRAAPPSKLAAPAASTSRRVHLIGSLHLQGLEFAIPPRTIGPHHHAARLRVTADHFLPGVPGQSPAQPQRDVGQVTGRRHAVGAFQIRDRLLTRLDAIEEVAYVQPELLPGVAKFVLNGPDPE